MQKDTLIRLSTILRQEIALRKGVYPGYIAEGRLDAEVADLRYKCLQKALLMVEPAPNKVTISVTLAQVLEEMDLWARDIQRNATPDTCRADGQRIRWINEFITHYSPASEVGEEQAVQTSLF